MDGAPSRAMHSTGVPGLLDSGLSSPMIRIGSLTPSTVTRMVSPSVTDSTSYNAGRLGALRGVDGVTGVAAGAVEGAMVVRRGAGVGFMDAGA